MKRALTPIAALLLVPLAVLHAVDMRAGPQASNANRKLNLRVKMAGFGDAGEADIKAVLRSAAGEIWKHCSDTRFEQPGFEIYHSNQCPITLFNPTGDGYIAIGLAVEGRLWARFSFQFAHEFTHALMDHSNDSRKLWHNAGHANMWLEECICETASLFTLRAMGRTWKTNPPYPNWKDYAPSLAKYAKERMDDPKHRLPAGTTFAAWFAAEEPGLRKACGQREKNTVIAQQLLPLFEAEPSGWEAVTWLKLCSRDTEKTLAKHLSEWHANAPAAQRPFIDRVAAVFSVKINEEGASRRSSPTNPGNGSIHIQGIWSNPPTDAVPRISESWN